MTDGAGSAQRKLAYLQTLGVDLWVRRVVPEGKVARVAAARAAADEAELPQDTEAQISAEVALPREVALSHEPALPHELALAPSAGPPREIAVPLQSLKPATRVPVPADFDVQWDVLKADVLSCTRCPLHATRTQGVFGVGNAKADWLVIGEAPGAEEDRRGEPFVGRAGQLLNAMLKAIGLPREQVYIANVLKSRPPSNRDPKPDEVAACIPYLMRQIALIQPRLILAVGRIAAQNLLQTEMALGRLRGQVHTFGELNTPLIVTYHPAYLLRTPADKRKAWEDLKFARSTFQLLASQEQ
jgi:uracil-DNA glycosylase